MIVRDKPGPYELLFAIRGSILPAITGKLLVLMGISAVMVAIQHRYGILPKIDSTGFTVFGVALSLFLGFRNNAAYDRWWEARKLWDGLLADLRSFARETDIFVPSTALRTKLLKDCLAFIHLHRRNLRKLRQDSAAEPVATGFEGAAHPPCAALDSISAQIAKAHKAGEIDGFGARSLSTRLGNIALQQAGCERIALTPLPFVYSLLIYRTSYLYCLLLPLALIDAAGWMTPVFVGIVAYVFLGLAEVTEELSHPFGATLNGLPLDAMCRAAEISLAPHAGLPVPEPLTSV